MNNCTTNKLNNSTININFRPDKLSKYSLLIWMVWFFGGHISYFLFLDMFGYNAFVNILWTIMVIPFYFRMSFSGLIIIASIISILKKIGTKKQAFYCIAISLGIPFLEIFTIIFYMRP